MSRTGVGDWGLFKQLTVLSPHLVVMGIDFVPDNFRACSFYRDSAVLLGSAYRVTDTLLSAFLLVKWLQTRSSPDGNQAISLGPREPKIPRCLKV